MIAPGLEGPLGQWTPAAAPTFAHHLSTATAFNPCPNVTLDIELADKIERFSYYAL